MTANHKRTPIPVDVRNRLWIAAAGRCEFKGCGKPVGVDFLTGRNANVGELAHIVSDSPTAARGDAARSKELARDEANLMLTCFDCHKRIDVLEDVEDYPETLLLRWKQEHEARVHAIYNAEAGIVSQPIIMALPIGAHLPSINQRQVQAAILKNSDYTVHPRHDAIVLSQLDLEMRDDDPEYWLTAERALNRWYERVLEPRFSGASPIEHVSVAAFAPIPMAMKLGALLGDKRPALVMDLPSANWLWRKDETSKQPADDWFVFDVPATLPKKVFVAVDISNVARDFEAEVAGATVVRFSAVSPKRELIGSQANLEGFKRRFNEFLLLLNRAGASELDLLPVTSLSTSVEIGRILLPKIFTRVTVWEYRDASWKRALNLAA